MAAGFLATILPSIIGGVSKLASGISQDCNRGCGFRHPFNDLRRQDCREACDITATKEAQSAAAIQQYSNAQQYNATTTQAGLLVDHSKLITYAAIGLATYYIIKKVK